MNKYKAKGRMLEAKENLSKVSQKTSNAIHI